MILRRCQPSETRAIHEWMKEVHYLKSAPPGHVAALEFIEGKERVGAMLLGRPAARSYDADLILELTRAYFVDSAPKNTESQGLSMMRAWVRKWLPGIRLLISYSDPAQGHTGTIYAADGWAPFGMTSGSHAQQSRWKSRPGRVVEQNYSQKQRWVRTP